MARLRRLAGIAMLFVTVSVLFGVVMGPAAWCAQEETIVGTVVKTDKGYIIEAEDGDYLVKGKDVSKMAGKMIEATGVITEGEKGDTIDVKSFEEIRE